MLTSNKGFGEKKNLYERETVIIITPCGKSEDSLQAFKENEFIMDQAAAISQDSTLLGWKTGFYRQSEYINNHALCTRAGWALVAKQ